MTEKTTPLAKLRDIDFSGETSHIALVSADQGGPANGADYKLVLKSNLLLTPEILEKAQKVKVTLELPEFLRKFFGVYYEDAEILARMMGYVPDADEDDYYEDYIEEKLNSFEIIKALNENLPETMAKLTGTEYLGLLKDQSLIEKTLRKMDREAKKAQKNSESPDSNEGTPAAVEKAVKNPAESGETNKDKNMSDVVDLQKALDEQKAELVKANEAIEAFKKEKSEALLKAKTSKVTDLVKDEKQAAVLLKAGLALADEDFDAFVDVIKAQQELISKAGLFTEQGVSTEEQKPQEGGVMALLKAQHGKK